MNHYLHMTAKPPVRQANTEGGNDGGKMWSEASGAMRGISSLIEIGNSATVNGRKIVSELRIIGQPH